MKNIWSGGFQGFGARSEHDLGLLSLFLIVTQEVCQHGNRHFFWFTQRLQVLIYGGQDRK